MQLVGRIDDLNLSIPFKTRFHSISRSDTISQNAYRKITMDRFQGIKNFFPCKQPLAEVCCEEDNQNLIRILTTLFLPINLNCCDPRGKMVESHLRKRGPGDSLRSGMKFFHSSGTRTLLFPSSTKTLPSFLKHSMLSSILHKRPKKHAYFRTIPLPFHSSKPNNQQMGQSEHTHTLARTNTNH